MMIMSWVIDTKSDSIHGLYDIFVIHFCNTRCPAVITRIKVVKVYYLHLYNGISELSDHELK